MPAAILAAATILALAVMSTPALGHGGSYRGPNGTVAPREPCRRRARRRWEATITRE